MRISEIKSACHALERDGIPVTFDNVALYGSVSNIESDEFEQALRELIEEAQERPQETLEAPAATLEPDCTAEEALAALNNTEDGLHAARQAHAVALAEERRARAEFTKVLLAWQTGQTVTRETVLKEYLANSQEQRRLRKEGLIAPPIRNARSAIDRAGHAQNYGDSADHVRRSFRNGGHKRGGMTLAQAQQVQVRLTGRAAPTAAFRRKLPSER